MSIRFLTLNHHDQEIIRGIIAGFLKGECYAFVIALHRDLGWPMIGLMKKEEVRHAAVQDPEGNFWDARGQVSENEFGEPFGLRPPYDLRVVTEADLLAIHPVFAMSIQRASKTAQSLWPELPWKPDALKCRVQTFAEELEVLSRKHGFWIRSFCPTRPAIIAEGDGEEKGYELGLTLDGNYTINRSFIEK